MTEKDLEELLSQKMFLELEEDTVLLTDTQLTVGRQFIDLIGVSADKKIVYVFELKAGEVNGSALAQVLNYMVYVEQMIKELHGDDSKEWKVKGVLIGDHMCDYTKTAIKKVPDVSFYEYHYNVQIAKHEYDIAEKTKRERSWEKQKEKLYHETTKAQETLKEIEQKRKDQEKK